MNFKKNDVIEKKHEKTESNHLCMKFYKYLLGIHNKATHIAVFGELGRVSLHVDIIISMLKYAKRLSHFNENHLLFQALQDCRSLDKKI